MSALTVLTPPEERSGLQPLPWRRMAWVIWRQHRIALAGVVVFLGALAACLWIVGLTLHHAYAAAIACHPATSGVCEQIYSRFSSTDGFLANGSVLQVVPALIGAFAGAPLLARELETGTFRYAWTQGFGRWRWTLAKLVSVATVVAAAAGAFSVLLDWYYQPYFSAALGTSQASPLTATLFDLRGVAFAAWTVAAFAIGALLGMLIRRVVTSIAATLAVYAGLAFGAGMYLRQHYLTPLITSAQNVPSSATVISQWGTKGGKLAFTGPPPLSLLQQVCPGPPRGTRGPAIIDKTLTIGQCLARHGYTWRAAYQPAGRFWPLQWIEGGWLLVLCVVLFAATMWLVRRRAS